MYQNAKQEAFWGPVEGRLMAMFEGVPDLTLAMLNEATQAWAEFDHNRKIHSEIGEAPITRFLAGPDVTRPCPDSDALRLAFTRTDHRMQRKSDGTVVIEGRRFEIPNRYRHLTRLEVRYAGWDLGLVHLVDERTGMVLTRLYPQDKTQNASGLRRTLSSIANGSHRPCLGGRRPARSGNAATKLARRAHHRHTRWCRRRAAIRRAACLLSRPRHHAL